MESLILDCFSDFEERILEESMIEEKMVSHAVNYNYRQLATYSEDMFHLLKYIAGEAILVK